MSPKNLILIAATYDDAAAARADHAALKDLAEVDLYVVSSVVLSRAADGTVDVDEGAAAVGGGAILGAGAGLVVGLFAPPLLLATAIGAGLGALGGQLLRKHDEKRIGLELDEVMPPNSSALIAIVDDAYADRVEKALTKAVKRVDKAVDAGDVEELQKALAKGEKELGKALDS